MAEPRAVRASAGRRRLVDWFAAGLGFELDAFQKEAIEHLVEGRSVLVAAPTGSGKTVVAKFAVHLALASSARAAYTSPLKALSNEKFREFCEELSAEEVGLLTGDVSIRPSARVVVMTTEVLRNMLYEGDPLVDELSHVILDEIHYLQDPERGSTWEEVILMLPERIRLVCLSATISNTAEFVSWLRTVRGQVECVSQNVRPVPLEVLYCYEDPRSDRTVLRRLWAKGSRSKPNPALVKALSYGRYRRNRYALTPHRLDVIRRLEEEGLTPAIYFVFSRKGCEQAAASVVAAGLPPVDRRARAEIERTALEAVAALTDAELEALRFGEFLDGLMRGVAAHHGGMVHQFKEVVEKLFARGLLNVVFATETLSLGIDMPARSVVLESFYKFDGHSHKLLTPAEFTQLSGRAGRRGKDDIGYAVVLHSPWLPLDHVVSTARSTRFTLDSSFNPGYNMVVNMIRKYPHREAVYEILGRSYAAFRSSRGSGRKGGTRGEALIARFEKYEEVLRKLGYLHERWQLAEKGMTLCGIYSERDVAFVEWLSSGVPQDLDVPLMAGVMSGFVSDDAGPERRGAAQFRKRALGTHAENAERAVHSVREVEADVFGRPITALPDFAFAPLVMGWARSKDPEALLRGPADPGDIIRHIRRVIDLARQAGESTGSKQFLELASELDVGIVSSVVPHE